MSVNLDEVPAVAVDDPFAPIITPDHAASSEIPAASDKKEKGPAPYGRTPAMPKDGVIAGGMQSFYVMIGMTWGMVDQQCGAAVVESSEQIGQAWESYAKANPKIRAALLRFLETGEFAKLFMAHAPLAMAIMAHHPALLGRGTVSDRVEDEPDFVVG